MEILVIHGSPKKNGHTEKLVENFLDSVDMNSLHHVYLYDENIEYCKGCLVCAKNGICFIDDDMQKLYHYFETVDVVIFATPMYFNSVSSAAKVMIDRTQQYWSRKFSLGYERTIEKRKKGVLLSTAGVKHTESSSEGLRKVIEIFFKAINCSFDLEYMIDELDFKPILERKNELEKLKEIGLHFFNDCIDI